MNSGVFAHFAHVKTGGRTLVWNKQAEEDHSTVK